MNKRQKNLEKGITLIALVITIIVTLILAGVAINTLFGDNGVLNKATTAKIKSENATVKEQAILLINEYQMYVQANGVTVNAIEFLQGQTIKTGSINGVKNEAKIASTDTVKIAETTDSNITAKVFMINKTTEYLASQETYLVDWKEAIPNGTTGRGEQYQNDQYLVEKDSNSTNKYILSYYNENGQKTELLEINTNGETTNPGDDEIYANYKRAIDSSNLTDVAVTYDSKGTYEWKAEYAGIDESIQLSNEEGGNFRITNWFVYESYYDYESDEGYIKIVPDFNECDIPDLQLKGAQGYNNGVKLLNDACASLYSSDLGTAKNLSLGEGDTYDPSNVDTTWPKPEGSFSFPSIYANELTGLGVSEQTQWYTGTSSGTSVNYTTESWYDCGYNMSVSWRLSNADERLWLATRGVSYYTNSCNFLIRSIIDSLDNSDLYYNENKLYGINISDGTTTEGTMSGTLCPIVTVDIHNVWYEPVNEEFPQIVGELFILDKKWEKVNDNY